MSGTGTEGAEVHAAQGDGRPPGIDELLERVRAGYPRVEAQEAYDAWRSGDALLVDIRYAALRERDGLIPGALVVERNELEWRLDPRGSHRLPEATGHGLRVVVICNEGTPPASPRSPSTGWGCAGPPIWSAASRPGGRQGCR